MGFKCGIVGLPNVGKSTLFKALTKVKVEIANFPFCTITSNTGIVPVPDPRINQLAKITKTKKIVPTTMKFVDIAGLVKGASKGKGLGNQFLTNIREMEAICYVVRCFENDNIIHISGKIDPVEDINIVNTELRLADLEICERAVERVQKRVNKGEKDAKLELFVLKTCLSYLNNTGLLYTLNLSDEEKKIIRYLNFLTLKPTMYIANVNEDGFDNNPHLDKVRNIATAEGSVVIAVCAIIESDITEFNKEERDNFIADVGLEGPSLNSIIRAGYNLLNLQTFFTVGTKEVHAWTIPIGITAQQAAGKIHTDFEKYFIRAKIISFADFINNRGEHGAKKTGKIRFESKNYLVKDGDIIHFLFNN